MPPTTAELQPFATPAETQIEAFITHLAEWAAKDRDALVCKLNSYSPYAGGGHMKRHMPGLHGATQNGDSDLEGLFLVRVERAFYRWHPQKPFFALCLNILEPKEYAGRRSPGGSTAHARALWKLSWFLRDFGYDTDLLGRDEIDEKALRGLRGVVRISHTVLMAVAAFSTSNGLLPPPNGRNVSTALVDMPSGRRPPMTFSHTQISQYLRCPRSYRYRYLDGWQEKDIQSVAAASAAASRRPWQPSSRAKTPEPCCSRSGGPTARPTGISRGDDWERVLRQGIGCSRRLAQDNRIRIRQPQRNLQKKLLRSLPNGNEFVAYVDAIGYLDGTQRLLEWKTTTARYPEAARGAD